MVAFALSILVTVVLLAGILGYMRIRPAEARLTWGEAMFGSMIVFFALFWVYGVVPHQFLTWADNELNWRSDKLFVGPGEVFKAQAQGGHFPFTINYVVIRDVLASGIYVVATGAHVGLWLLWQNRGKMAADAKEVELSSFGRPLMREGSDA